MIERPKTSISNRSADVVPSSPASRSPGGNCSGRTLARTPDVQPDFQGYWTNGTYVPLERPKDLAGKEFFTEEEAAAYQKKKVQEDHSQAADDVHYDNVI